MPSCFSDSPHSRRGRSSIFDDFPLTAPSSPKETDQRLTFWLDTNQLDRERMCQAVLSLNRHFEDVTPRHPHGGPDGGRDIEARYEDGRQAWGAVGFVVRANDSKEHKRAAKKKFTDDLDRALREKPSLLVFVFFTNVRLTGGEKDELLAIAKRNKIEICEIYDRERSVLSSTVPMVSESAFSTCRY